MKKIICLILILIFAISYSDQISFSWTPQNTDTLTGVRYKADRKAITNIANGKIGNDNIKEGANISQSKIDSGLSAGWISDNVGRFLNATGYRELHSEKGWKVFSNDTTTYGNPIIFFSDSTDTILKISPESTYITKPLHVKDSSYFGGIVRVKDSITVKGIRATGTIRGDSANIEKSVVASRGYYDSIQIGGGSWIKQAEIDSFTDVIENSQNHFELLTLVRYYRFNNNVSLGMTFSGTGDAFIFSDTLGPGTDYKMLLTQLPSTLRPASLKTINMPLFSEIGSPGVGSGSAVFKIPSSSSAPCTLIVSMVGVDMGGTIQQANISYSLD
ncbi:MAG: hypothetical protein WC716_16445 [Chitinophagaceae bacterium]|jgi:hypothetical protein